MTDPINTGPGGFDVDGKTFTFDTGLSEKDGGSQGVRHPTINVDAGFLDANGKPKDLTQKTKTTLSQYLSKITKGQGGSTPIANRYTIDQNSNTLSTTTKDGNPALQSPGGAPTLNAESFSPSPDETSSFTPRFPAISPHIKKGKAAGSATDGNDLLPGIPGDSSFTADAGQLNGTSSQTARPVKGHADTTGVVKPYVSAVLASNRFALANTNQGQQAFTETGGGSDAGFNPALTMQKRLGQYDPLAESATFGRLATIGPLLTMRAGKELNAASSGADPNDGGLQAKAILPGVGQLGLSRIDQQVLLASDVLAGLTTDELDSANVLSIGKLSWGQLNNADDPYSGTDALGMLALSIALVAGLELLIDALSVLLGLITPSLKTPARDGQGRYSLGEYLPGSKQAKKSAAGGIGGALSALTSLNFGALLGIQPTNYPFNRALTTGLNAFFGIPDSGGGSIGLNQLVGAFTSSTDSPGFNVVVARGIIRSSLTIVDQMKKIGGNVMNAITQILALIDTIRSSKLVAACNIFATLGDAILSNPKDFVDQDTANVKVSAMDSKADVLAGAVGKSRLKGTLKLAWASNTAPANILLPASIIGTSLALVSRANMGQFSPFMGVKTDAYSQLNSIVPKPDAGARIDTQTAIDFESELGASYVPFYFHDVRTNEMISFHAFLASLTDDYTASYDKAEGFGRVEAVKIYKGTERRVGLSFYVVATSLPDFDEMWVKINKLITLVYPQYTQGVQLSSADGEKYRFTQPFSQLVGASPLVRIRLGDLLRSNYSLFALGRMFGMGNKNFKIDGKDFKGADSIDQGALDKLSKALQQIMQNPNGETYAPCAGLYPYFKDPGGLGVSLPVPSIPGVGSSKDGPDFATTFNPGSAYGGIFEVKVKKVHPDNPTLVIGEIQYASKFDTLKAKVKKAADEEYNNSDRKITKVIGGTYVFPISSLVPTDKTVNDASANANTVGDALGGITAKNTDFANAVADFLSVDNNAIAKSFKDTGGKGLAGFIESISFDWYDKVTWETERGRVAPKMCKVTIGFSPIHDISPGIDHLGFNRAPVYPVGGMGQQE